MADVGVPSTGLLKWVTELTKMGVCTQVEDPCKLDLTKIELSIWACTPF